MQLSASHMMVSRASSGVEHEVVATVSGTEESVHYSVSALRRFTIEAELTGDLDELEPSLLSRGSTYDLNVRLVAPDGTSLSGIPFRLKNVGMSLSSLLISIEGIDEEIESSVEGHDFVIKLRDDYQYTTFVGDISLVLEMVSPYPITWRADYKIGIIMVGHAVVKVPNSNFLRYYLYCRIDRTTRRRYGLIGAERMTVVRDDADSAWRFDGTIWWAELPGYGLNATLSFQTPEEAGRYHSLRASFRNGYVLYQSYSP